MYDRQNVARANGLVTNELFSSMYTYIEQSVYTYDVSFLKIFIMSYAAYRLRTVFPI
jgi:hypothetical protein